MIAIARGRLYFAALIADSGVQPIATQTGNGF